MSESSAGRVYEAILLPLRLPLATDAQLPIDLDSHVRILRFDRSLVDIANVRTASGSSVFSAHEVDDLCAMNCAVVADASTGQRTEETARQDLFRAVNSLRLGTGRVVDTTITLRVRVEGVTARYANQWRRDVPVVGNIRTGLVTHHDLELVARLYSQSGLARERYESELESMRARGSAKYPHVPLTRALQTHHMVIRTSFGEARVALQSAVLEALVLAESGFASSDFRRRAKILAGPDPAPLDEDRLKYLYTLRSTIVHGDILPSGVSKQQDPDVVQELESIVDRVLIRALLDAEVFEVLGSPLRGRHRRHRVREYFARHGDMSVDERDAILRARFEHDLAALHSREE